MYFLCKISFGFPVMPQRPSVVNLRASFTYRAIGNAKAVSTPPDGTKQKTLAIVRQGLLANNQRKPTRSKAFMVFKVVRLSSIHTVVSRVCLIWNDCPFWVLNPYRPQRIRRSVAGNPLSGPCTPGR